MILNLRCTWYGQVDPRIAPYGRKQAAVVDRAMTVAAGSPPVTTVKITVLWRDRLWFEGLPPGLLK